MSRAIPTTHQRQLNNVREAAIRNREAARRQDEVLRAKWIQRQTGCTWTEALRAAYRT